MRSHWFFIQQIGKSRAFTSASVAPSRRIVARASAIHEDPFGLPRTLGKVIKSLEAASLTHCSLEASLREHIRSTIKFGPRD